MSGLSIAFCHSRLLLALSVAFICFVIQLRLHIGGPGAFGSDKALPLFVHALYISLLRSSRLLLFRSLES